MAQAHGKLHWALKDWAQVIFNGLKISVGMGRNNSRYGSNNIFYWALSYLIKSQPTTKSNELGPITWTFFRKKEKKKKKSHLGLALSMFLSQNMCFTLVYRIIYCEWKLN